MLIEGPRDASRQAVLNAGGTLVEHPDLLPSHVLARLTPAQQAAVEHAGLRTGRAIPEFATAQHILACALTGPASAAVSASDVTIGDGWDGPGQGSVKLTYTWGSMAPLLGNPEAMNKADVLSAMKQWSSVAAIDFVQGSDWNAYGNINVAFLPNNHGDAPFDSAMAHAFYPSPSAPEPYAGDVHFNDTLPWYLYKVDAVALHELGHALGLTHRVDTQSIMYPYYQGMQWSGADVAAIQMLYAPRSATPQNPTTTPTTPQEPTIPPPGTRDRSNVNAALAMTASAPAATTESSVALNGTISNGTAPYTMTWRVNGASGGATVSTPWCLSAIPLEMGNNTIILTLKDAAQTVVTQTLYVQRTAADNRSRR